MRTVWLCRWLNDDEMCRCVHQRLSSGGDGGVWRWSASQDSRRYLCCYSSVQSHQLTHVSTSLSPSPPSLSLSVCLSQPLYWWSSFNMWLQWSVRDKTTCPPGADCLTSPAITDELIKWSQDNKILINCSKTKERQNQIIYHIWRLMES